MLEERCAWERFLSLVPLQNIPFLAILYSIQLKTNSKKFTEKSSMKWSFRVYYNISKLIFALNETNLVYK